MPSRVRASSLAREYAIDRRTANVADEAFGFNHSDRGEVASNVLINTVVKAACVPATSDEQIANNSDRPQNAKRAILCFIESQDVDLVRVTPSLRWSSDVRGTLASD